MVSPRIFFHARGSRSRQNVLMDMEMLTGLAFKGYRSFASDEFAILAPLRKINLIAGQNNVGKSNVLRVVRQILQLATEGAHESSRWDRPLGDVEHDYEALVAYPRIAVESWLSDRANSKYARSTIGRFLSLPDYQIDNSQPDLVWLQAKGSPAKGAPQGNRVAQSLSRDQFALQVDHVITNGQGGPPSQAAFRAHRAILSLQPQLFRASEVAGVREISSESDEAWNLNGRSIKRRLLQLQNPSSERLEDRALFLEIQEFVRAVMDDPSVTIDVPHDLATIHVTQDGRTLPIEYIGTGIHEVVIIAAAATLVRNSVMCIEEPEVHLHPILQRKLLFYLATRTSNQYFIATHSAHMLDSELGAIFHVTRAGGHSRIRYAGSARERAAVCADLGYRPSDLVQTNAVLWVEGPSDRIYLKHWIEKLAPGRFLEGTHYSIMFYGGALLGELSPLDHEEVEEFISLKALNRYMMVLMDSDRTGPRKKVNAAKQRVIDGIASDPDTGVAWVTFGYTIENYVPEEVLTAAIKAAHPTLANKTFSEQTRYENPLATARIGLKSPSKVAIAKKAVGAWADEWPNDLKKKVQSVIALIERANANA